MNWRGIVENTSWLKQTPEQPLFPDILWSRPENKKHAGKLLIIGGNTQGFAAVAASYAAAIEAGAGSVRIMLPDMLQKAVGKLFPEAMFAPSNLSGGFGRQALAEFIDHSQWADGVLLSGDFGRNSETTVLLESFYRKYAGQLSIGGDGLDSLSSLAHLKERKNSLVICDIQRLQKLAAGTVLIKNSMDLRQMVTAITDLSRETKLGFITIHSDQIIVSIDGKSSTTPAQTEDLYVVAAYASVWWLQQPSKSFEAITSAVFEVQKTG